MSAQCARLAVEIYYLAQYSTPRLDRDRTTNYNPGNLTGTRLPPIEQDQCPARYMQQLLLSSINHHGPPALYGHEVSAASFGRIVYHAPRTMFRGRKAQHIPTAVQLQHQQHRNFAGRNVNFRAANNASVSLQQIEYIPCSTIPMKEEQI